MDTKSGINWLSGQAPLQRRAALLSCLIGAVLLAGCEKQPGGQVVAVVGDDEITLTELRAEAKTPASATGPAVQAANEAALARLVDRNVLADYAREKGFDRSPDFVARRRQVEQSLLASLAIRDLAGTPPKPTPEEVRRFVASNGTLFAQRQRLDMDRIQIDTPGNAAEVQSLVKLQNLDLIAAELTRRGVKFQRGRGFFDTASVPPEIAKQIASLPNGEVFDLTTGGATYIAVITGRSAVANKPENWDAAAAALLARQQVATKVQAELDKLRKGAKINYDAAYRPKPAAS